MQLIYNGGGETVIFDIDRKNKILHVGSSLTNNKLVRKEWSYLFDKGKEKLQELVTDKLSDNVFIESITWSMNKNGYSLITKC